MSYNVNRSYLTIPGNMQEIPETADNNENESVQNQPLETATPEPEEGKLVEQEIEKGHS